MARKGQTRFEESPYTIKTINGNMIEASNGHKTVCRNASEFKRFVPARADVNRTSARRTPVVFDQRKTDDDEDDFEWTINTTTVTAEVPAVDPPIAPAEPPVNIQPVVPRRNKVALPVGQEDKDDDSLSALFGSYVDERDEATSTSTGPMDCD